MKKSTKALIAGGIGVALLVGGAGTVAFWTDEADGGDGVITAGTLDLGTPAGPLRFSGYFAWLFWLFAHVYFLIGFRNRFVVLLDWAWAYWTHDRHARVVSEANPGRDAPV